MKTLLFNNPIKKNKDFHEFLLKRINLENNNRAELIEKKEDCAKFEMILKMLGRDEDKD